MAQLPRRSAVPPIEGIWLLDALSPSSKARGVWPLTEQNLKEIDCIEAEARERLVGWQLEVVLKKVAGIRREAERVPTDVELAAEEDRLRHELGWVSLIDERCQESARQVIQQRLERIAEQRAPDRSIRAARSPSGCTGPRQGSPVDGFPS